MYNTLTRPLNTTDGWENIVNANAAQRSTARERVAARKMERRIRKLLTSVCVTAGLGIAFVILGVTGAMVSWLAAAVAVLCLMAGCLQLGCYLEAKKK